MTWRQQYDFFDSFSRFLKHLSNQLFFNSKRKCRDTLRLNSVSYWNFFKTIENRAVCQIGKKLNKEIKDMIPRDAIKEMFCYFKCSYRNVCAIHVHVLTLCRRKARKKLHQNDSACCSLSHKDVRFLKGPLSPAIWVIRDILPTLSSLPFSLLFCLII